MAMDDLRGRRLGGFELLEPVGQGSFGTVWRARQVRLDRDVAVKILDPTVARDPTAARRFEREGRAAASLDHPSIVPVYEAGDDDGLYYLAMRLVDGGTFADAIDRDAPMSPETVADTLAPIGDGLDAAHAAGLIHRDVKPANILIEEGRPYLGDFGIAASARELGRYTTGSIGTAEYMAPEQARGETIGHRADLYSLACVAFHAITGSSPFARDDVVATLLAHTVDDPPSTGDDDLDRFFDTALAKDPADRFESGRAMTEALRRATSIVDAPPPSSVVADSPRPRRRIGVPALLGVLALVGGAVAVGVTLGGGDDAAPSTSSAASARETASPTTAATPTPTPTPIPASTPTLTVPATTSTPTSTSTSPVAAAPGGSIQPGGSVAVGTSLTLDDPNPHANRDVAKLLAHWVLPVMYRIDERLDAVPSLAIGPPEVDPVDPLLLTWRIHDDVLWNDGSAVTTADLVATHEYLAAADTNAQNLLLYDLVESVVAVDATTLSIRLREPTGAAYLLFSTIHPVIQASAWADHQAEGGTAASFLDGGVDFSAGPYQLATRQNPGEIALVRNPTWIGEQPPLDRVAVANYSDSSALVEAQAIGQVDVIWVDDVERSEILDASALPDTNVVLGNSDSSVQLTFNVRSGALADERVRTAVMRAIDRNVVADIVVGPKTSTIAEPWNSLVFAPDQGGDQQPFADSYDVAEANRLLDEAGWLRPDDSVFRRKDGEDLAMTIVLPADSDSINTAIAIEDALQAVGIDITGTPASSEITSERLSSGAFDLALQRRVFNNDPVATAFSFSTSGCPSTVPGCSGEGVNFGAFSDAEVDSALIAAEQIADPEARIAAYADIDRLLSERAAALPLYVDPAFTASRDDLAGIRMAPNVGPIVSIDEWGFVSDP